ncbi:hypothetical protein BPOR_0607g00030 [Botrytis porri]|uniref:Uncharacterized protein n=1 Tax=Botrytis porri TaxID=87229 RepID=A0A4Z1KC63_9HELO|nr:hypothetical protein BPOR_0607g00030 [Botrytis porri]
MGSLDQLSEQTAINVDRRPPPSFSLNQRSAASGSSSRTPAGEMTSAPRVVLKLPDQITILKAPRNKNHDLEHSVWTIPQHPSSFEKFQGQILSSSKLQKEMWVLMPKL